MPNILVVPRRTKMSVNQRFLRDHNYFACLLTSLFFCSMLNGPKEKIGTAHSLLTLAL